MSGPAPSTSPGSSASPSAVDEAVRSRAARTQRLAELRDRLIAGIAAVVPDVVLSGDPGQSLVDGGPSRLPGNAHLRFPGCEGDSLLMLLDAQRHRVLHRLRVHGRGAQPVARAAGHGHRGGRRPRRAAVLARPHADRGRRARGDRGHRAGGRAGSRAAALAGDEAALMARVVAAMSGGVDSAVAAALAVDAGHDVVGVHLALSRIAGHAAHRLPRVLHRRGRVRRPPGLRPARHSLLRLGFQRGVRRGRGGRLPRGVRGGPHPEPVPAVQREDQVRRPAGPRRRAGVRRGGHRPSRPARRRGAVPVGGRGQGPVVRAGRADAGAVGAQPVPARRA